MDIAYRDFLARRREEILSVMDAALARSGRSLSDAELVAVSKTVGPDEVMAAMDAGYARFAENRPQELVRKLGALDGAEYGSRVVFDMIGNLQTNKINSVLGRVALVQSISSLHLARAVSSRVERAFERGDLACPQGVLLEVNVSGEESKSGFSTGELYEVLPQLKELCGIRIHGLMTMAPRGDKDRARATFSGLRDLRDDLVRQDRDLDLSVLSCGMSEDFDIALEEGSTLVRLGRVVFDPDFEVK